MTHDRINKSVLDKLAAWLDRREIRALREKILAYEAVISSHEKTIDEQIQQIASANGRVSRTTNANLELKRFCSDNGLNADGLAA